MKATVEESTCLSQQELDTERKKGDAVRFQAQVPHCEGLRSMYDVTNQNTRIKRSVHCENEHIISEQHVSNWRKEKKRKG